MPPRLSGFEGPGVTCRVTVTVLKLKWGLDRLMMYQLFRIG